MGKELMTTADAAAYLGVEPSRIRQIAAKLKGEKYGRDWLFKQEHLDAYRASIDERNEGKPGRPFKV